jgi:uncharacterized OB-fold protein
MKLDIIKYEGSRPLPIEVTKVTQPFWNELSNGVFQTTYCVKCDQLSFPPRSICPRCHSAELSWKKLSGKGILYSYTTVHAVPPAFKSLSPLKVAIIDLEEGVRVVTRLINENVKQTLDSRVQLVVTEFSDGCLFAAKNI